MLAEELDYLVGVDTHRDEHLLAAVAAPSGAVLARQPVGANRGGYREALRFAERYAPGRRAWAIEGAGHHGAGLARFPRRVWRDGARDQPPAPSGAPAAR